MLWILFTFAKFKKNACKFFIMKEDVRFLPWIGQNYVNGGIFNKKILILADL